MVFSMSFLNRAIQRLRRWSPARANRHRVTVEDVLRALSQRHTPFSFVQVGSSDGTLNDPLQEYVKRRAAVGLFIEPLPASFAKLRSQYEGYTALRYINAAISSSRGVQRMYIIAPRAGDPQWAYQVASFDKDVLLKHVDSIPDIANRIESVHVDCRRLDEIMSTEDVRCPHLLHIDTEGYDYQVLKTFPFAHCRPAAVIFEHKHLSKVDLKRARLLLTRKGYRVTECGEDAVATQFEPRHIRSR